MELALGFGYMECPPLSKSHIQPHTGRKPVIPIGIFIELAYPIIPIHNYIDKETARQRFERKGRIA